MEFLEKTYFESAEMVIFFVEVGRFIENKNKNKTKDAIKKLVTITPQKATIIVDDDEKEVTLDLVNKGDILLCRPGEKIAVDGEIISGSAHFDDSFITGESFPVKKDVGSKVVAGSLNFDGAVKYRAEKIGRDSTISEIVKLVVEASGSKAPIGKIADRISGIFVPIVMIISTVSLIVWYFITKDFGLSINYLVSTLVVACPCSLGLATPLAIVVAQGKATSNGILIKDAEVLENAHKMKNILFDKTGTLTYGELRVSKIYNYSNEAESDILKYAATIEKKSEHPIAKAIVKYAKEKNAMIVACKDFKALEGMGAFAKIKDDEFYIGNQKLLKELNIPIIHQEDEDALSKVGNSILYVVKNNEVLALIGVKDIVREDAKELVQKLSEKNINSMMLTGDNEITANKIAEEIGTSKVFANCSPKEKAEIVKQQKEAGITAMCGDGINDSISLVNSDIGIAISNGTDVSINSSNVILMNDNLSKILDLIDISKKTVRVIKQNLFWAFIYNVLMIPIACGLFSSFGVTINPMIGSLAMMISSIIVVLNSLRLKS
jgi:Cu+-exporting ATPase